MWLQPRTLQHPCGGRVGDVQCGMGVLEADLEVELALDESIVPHVQLWVDTDNNPNTGWVQPEMGVELVMDFANNEVRRYNAGGVQTTLSFNNIGLHGAPTYSGLHLNWRWTEAQEWAVVP